MSLFSLNKNYISLVIAFFITAGFFVAGLLEVLDYVIVKVLLFSSFGILVLVALNYAIKNETKKKSP